MAELTRVHPASTPDFPVSMGGSTETITYIEVDYLAAANGKTGPESALQAVYKTIGRFGTIIYLGPFYDSNTKQIIGIEGIVGDDEDVADFATLTVMQTAVRALGTVDSLNLSSATVIRGGPSEAKQDAIA